MRLELIEFYDVVNFCAWFTTNSTFAVVEFPYSFTDRIGGMGFFFRQGMLGTSSGAGKRQIMASVIHWGF